MIIGITGGVGCGKSTVLDILRDKYNAYIIDADKEAHSLMEKGCEVYNREVELFGESILDSDKNIDRKKVGQIVFHNPELLRKLNEIVHPAVREKIKMCIREKQKENPDGMIAVEAALFEEAGLKEICRELWYVYADREIRTDRLMKSRNYTREKAESIMRNQRSDGIFRENSDFVIDNSFSYENTLSQIENKMVNLRE